MTLGRTRGARGRTRERQRDADRESDGLTESVVAIRRVAKTVAGGRRFTFNALVVVGDGKGKIGYGLGKASEVPLAVQKGSAIARRSLIDVATLGSSVPQQVVSRFGAAQILLRPAAPGTGVRASAAVRAVVQAVGVRDILTKSQGSNNPINVVQATIKGLQMMRDPREAMSLRRMVRGEPPLPPKEPEPKSDFGPAPISPQPVSSDTFMVDNAEDAPAGQTAAPEATAAATEPAAAEVEAPAVETEAPAVEVESAPEAENSDDDDDEDAGS
jgi:small subunit ribosomal protein S5